MEPLDAESELEKTLRGHDEEMIARYNSDIDTLLVFAGLFAAILATFNVQSYQSLQGDQVPLYAVRVNAIWFAALVCSLFSASLAILVKQWFREYLNWNCTATEERLRVRHTRYLGLVHWRVFEMAAVLPLLLQFSLLLFFAGLSELLRTLNFTVWLSTTVLIAFWFILYAVTLLAPAFSSKCPYKTPLLDHWMKRFRGFCSRGLFGRDWRVKLGYSNHFYRFPGDERGVRRDMELDIPAMISADATLGDNRILSQHIQHCLRRAAGEAVVIIVRGLFANRLDRPVKSLFQPMELERIPTQPLRTLMHILLNAVESQLNTPYSTWPAWTREAVTCLAAIVKHCQVHDRFIKANRCFIVFSAILALGPKEAQELLIILAHRFPIVAWHVPPDSNSIVFSNTIVAATTLLSSARDDPLRLSSSILSILASLPTRELHRRREEIADLMGVLAPAIRAHRMTPSPRKLPWYFRDALIAQHILGDCQTLSLKLPDIIPNGLWDDVQRIRGSTDDLNEKFNFAGGESWSAPYFHPAGESFRRRVFMGAYEQHHPSSSSQQWYDMAIQPHRSRTDPGYSPPRRGPPEAPPYMLSPVPIPTVRGPPTRPIIPPPPPRSVTRFPPLFVPYTLPILRPQLYAPRTPREIPTVTNHSRLSPVPDPPETIGGDQTTAADIPLPSQESAAEVALASHPSSPTQVQEEPRSPHPISQDDTSQTDRYLLSESPRPIGETRLEFPKPNGSENLEAELRDR